LSRGWSGRATAWLAIGGFVATLFCYLGVNLLLPGLHSYGS
jgi:ABC-type transport system involved in cytochrome c biogenesis permease subunit